MTVYIVVRGACTEDLSTEAVFTDKEQAELYCATHFDCEIDEWEADEAKISPEDIYVKYQIIFDDEFKKIMVTSGITLEQEKWVQIFKNLDYVTNYKVTICVKRDTPESEAVKIARGYLVQHLKQEIEEAKAALALRMEALENES